ncbi:hypothetical protein GCM10027514_07450 [Azotobacter armeniacus]
MCWTAAETGRLKAAPVCPPERDVASRSSPCRTCQGLPKTPSAPGIFAHRQDSGTDLALAQWHDQQASPAPSNNNKQRCEMSESSLPELLLSAQVVWDTGDGPGPGRGSVSAGGFLR